MPWHVMRNGVTSGQFSRGRADEVAVYDTRARRRHDRPALRGRPRHHRHDRAGGAAGLTATAFFGRVVLDWPDSAETDLDGYDVFRATSPAGPFTRVNASRLSASTYTDASVTGGTDYVYVIRASDIANHHSADSPPATATPPSTETLLRRYSPELRYEAQESYFADSAAEMTDNFVASSRQNYLVNSSGTRIAAANPADPLANLSLGFLGDPVYADGRTATTGDYLDAANTNYQQDAQRMRAAGYADRVYGRAVASGGRTWLQYWLFYYYNPQNVLGFGVHEGDWEFIQVGLDADGAPDVATYAQHSGGEQCAWSRVRQERRGARRLCRPRLARVLLHRGRARARLLSRRQPPRRRLPRAAGSGGRHGVDAVHGLAWALGRVVVEPRRAAPPGQVGRSRGFHAAAPRRPVTATASRGAGSRVRAPRDRRASGRLAGRRAVRYRVRARATCC